MKFKNSYGRPLTMPQLTEIVLSINSVRLEESSMRKDKYSLKFDGKIDKVDRKN